MPVQTMITPSTNISTTFPKVNPNETTNTRMQAACSGSLITSFLMTPLDVIKIRLQAQTRTQAPTSSPQLISNSFTSLLRRDSPCLIHAPNCKYYHFSNGLMEHICPRDTNSSITRTATKENLVFRGSIDAAVKIVRHEGVFALWNGLPPTLIMALPATVLYMMGYDEIKMRLEKIPATAPLAPMYSGVIARIIATTAVSPFEVLRTRMQAGVLNKETPFTRQLIETFRSGSVIFRGLGATLLRDVPFSGIYWMGLEVMKKFMHSHAGIDPSHTFLTSFASGAISGMFTAALTTPFDVLKTRLQIEIFSIHETGEQKPRHLIKQIYREHGLKGFWAGVVPRTMRVGFACAVMIATYDFAKKLLSQKS